MKYTLIFFYTLISFGCSVARDNNHPGLPYMGLGPAISIEELSMKLSDYYGKYVIVYGVFSSYDVFSSHDESDMNATEKAIRIRTECLKFSRVKEGSWVIVGGWLVRSDPSALFKYKAELVGVECVESLTAEEVQKLKAGAPLDCLDRRNAN